MINPKLMVFAGMLLKGALVTIYLSALSLLLALVLGIIFGILRTSRNVILRNVVRVYVELFRSLPLLLLMFFMFFAAPVVLRLDVPPFTAVVVSLVLYVGAYMTEIVRGAIESVHHAQWEAAYSLALRPTQVLRYVIMPQAVRVAIPPTVGLLVGSIKDSSLASAVGYVELTRAGLTIRNVTMTSFGVLFVVAAIYFVICSVVSRLGSYLERRLQFPH
jgi:His/Glu/Gln/Arg/opine family amino acid ABC transporter permease subunit